MRSSQRSSCSEFLGPLSFVDVWLKYICGLDGGLFGSFLSQQPESTSPECRCCEWPVTIRVSLYSPTLPQDSWAVAADWRKRERKKHRVKSRLVSQLWAVVCSVCVLLFVVSSPALCFLVKADGVEVSDVCDLFFIPFNRFAYALMSVFSLCLFSTSHFWFVITFFSLLFLLFFLLPRPPVYLDDEEDEDPFGDYVISKSCLTVAMCVCFVFLCVSFISFCL